MVLTYSIDTDHIFMRGYPRTNPTREVQNERAGGDITEQKATQY